MEENKELIGYADEYSEVDLLGGNKYYEGLSHFIIKCETPMTISIQGDWGTGKTTALNLIQKKIQAIDESKYQIMWFRTWQYSKFGMEQNMTLSLMTNLYSKLLSIAKSKGVKIDSSCFPIKNILSEGISTVVDKIGGSRLGEKAESLSKYMLGIEEIADVSKQLEETKDKIQKCIDSIVSEDERLIIFIDDLDRLEPKIAIELLEGLKIFLDCKRCVYVLAVDSKVVFQGVKSKYGDEFGDEKAKKFFDKIIQVPFNLPVNQYDLNRYIAQFLDSSESVEKYSIVVTKLLGTNPRSIKRAFNLLQLYELIMIDTINNPIDKINLFSIILFQIKDEKSYNELVEAARQSSEAVIKLINNPDFKIIIEALNLENTDSTDDACIDFIELLINTSQISINTLSKESESPIEYEKIEINIESIINRVNPNLKKIQINSNVINFNNESDSKVCSFRINNDSLNIVVYSSSCSSPLELPKLEKLLNKTDCNKNNITITDDQLGYYKSDDHITFVEVQQCKNITLLQQTLQFYNIYL